MPDWGVSRCPHCGLLHRETLYAYPPQSLINRFVAKARADGARALLVVPLAVTAPYWTKLLQASVLPNGAGYVRVRAKQNATRDSDSATALAIFAVDFSLSSYRARLQHASPPCDQTSRFRGRPLLGSLADQAERARIQQSLLELRSSLRPDT